jgi:uncharacterized membrane protein
MPEVFELFRQMLSEPAFPNLHAVVVHFPVALLLTATLLDLACLVARRATWLDRATTTLYVLGTLGAGAAFLSGDAASEDLWDISTAAEAVMENHESLALLTLVAFALITALRLLVSHLGRRDKRITVGFFRLLTLGAALAAQLLLATTAHLGGSLVYRHGIALDAPESPADPVDELEP